MKTSRLLLPMVAVCGGGGKDWDWGLGSSAGELSVGLQVAASYLAAGRDC